MLDLFGHLGFFAYSCLTELPDGNFALLYEDEPAHLQYMIFSLSENGEIREINGKDNAYAENFTAKQQKKIKMKRRIADLQFAIGLR